MVNREASELTIRSLSREKYMTWTAKLLMMEENHSIIIAHRCSEQALQHAKIHTEDEKRQ